MPLVFREFKAFQYGEQTDTEMVMPVLHGKKHGIKAAVRILFPKTSFVSMIFSYSALRSSSQASTQTGPYSAMSSRIRAMLPLSEAPTKASSFAERPS